MAARVRIVFTPVLDALKSGLAQARNMLQGALAPLQKIADPFGDFSFGIAAQEQTADLKKIEAALRSAGYEAKAFAATMREMGGAPFTATAAENIGIIKATGGEFSNLRDVIVATIGQYRELQNRVENWGLSTKNTAKVTAALQAQMEGVSDTLAREFIPNFKEVEAALRAAGYEGGVFGATTEQINRALNQAGGSATKVLGAAIINLGKYLGGAGRKLSWFGFRLLMVGRIFTRFVTKTLKKTIQGFTKWDDSITQIGTSMGFLAASGMLTADTQAMMVDAMRDLPQVGMQVQGIMGAISALFINMGADIIPLLGGALMDLIMAISEVWEATKADLIPIFERLATETIPRFIEILRSVGPDAITGFVSGLETGINALTGLLDILEPHLPALSRFLGYLVGIAPVLTALGMGLFFMSVPLQVVSSIISIATGLWRGLGIVMGGVKTLLPVLKVAIGVLGGPLTAVIAVLVLFAAAWATNFGNIRGIVKGFFDWFSRIAERIANMFGGIIKKVKDFVGSFGKANEGVSKFQDTHDDMMYGLEDAYGQSIGKDMAKQYGLAQDAMQSLINVSEDFDSTHNKLMRDLNAGLTELPGGNVIRSLAEGGVKPADVTQYNTITIEMNVESLSADTDMDALVDEMSRRLAEQIEIIG